MTQSLDALNLEGAKSEVLRGAIACVVEATAMDGSPRYSRRVVAALTRMIVCRVYAKTTLELSHLISAISDSENRFEHVLWGVDRATPASFRAHVKSVQLIDRKAKITRRGITHLLDDQEFQISYGRLPLLTAFIEFLITILGYQRVDEITAPIRSKSKSIKDVGDVANALQRELYAFLKQNLPPAHRQKRERHFLQFVDEQAGNRMGADAISDDVVLAYWQTNATDNTYDNKTYRSVYEMAVRMVIALDTASERIKANNAAPIGTDREHGEYDPEDVEMVMAAFDPDNTPLARVEERSADAVKFITATEVELLSALPMQASVERRVPISILRNAVQGSLQLRISAALRRGAALNIDQQAGSYESCVGKYNEVAMVLERVLAASLWVLYSARHNMALSVALTLAPDMNWGILAKSIETEDDDTSPVIMDVHRAMRQFFESTPDLRGEELQALLAESRQAYRSINRKGFVELDDPESIAAVSEGVEDLTALIVAIRRYTEREVANIDWVSLEREDTKIFKEMIARLYLQGLGIAADD